MNRQRLLLLWGFVSLFLLLAGLFAWNYIHLSQTSFLAGTIPTVDQAVAATPTLPPSRSTDPMRGSADKNAVQIVEFADFSCLYCRITETEVQKALAGSAKPVRLVWRDLPVATENPDGILAAMAGRCANDQGKFWQMHDTLFQADQFDLDHLKTAAQQVGLDPTSFDQCLTSGKYLSAIQAEITLAQQNNINSTPTFFIGKTVLSGYTTADEFLSAIQNAQP